MDESTISQSRTASVSRPKLDMRSVSLGLELRLSGESVVLLPQKAVWWPARSTVLIADTHFGKAATFRSHGIPIGDESLEQDLERLSEIVNHTSADRVVVLGDLLHARRGRSPQTLARITRWRTQHRALAVELVRGNHDRAAGPPVEDWQMGILPDEHREGPFAFCHYPKDVAGAYVLAGHLHPKIVVPFEAAGKAKLACFWIRPQHAVLPAFGSFIDSAAVAPLPEDRVYAIAESHVHDVTALTVRSR